MVEIWPEGTPNFPDRTHIIERLDEEQPMCRLWWVTVDGKSNWPDGVFDIINVPGATETIKPVVRFRGVVEKTT